MDNRTGVFVLQHPRERFHPLGTARFVSLGLARSQLEVAYGALPGSVTHPIALPEGTALLYPAADAPFLEDLQPAERPTNLLVLDGTWSQSRALYRQNPWLEQLPHRQIRPMRPSRYRVRREPRPEYVSTLEAVVYALGVLEPEIDLTPLLEAFERLMDDHLASRAPSSQQPRCRRPRQRRSRAVPTILVDEPQRLAVLYVEPSLADAQPGSRVPVQVCALRLGDRARFEAFARAHGVLPSPHHLRHMGLTEGAFDGALDAARVARDLRAFLDGCVAVSWNRTSADLLAAVGHPLAGWVSLKASYCNLRKRHVGALESVLTTEGLRAEPLPFAGRAAQRMGNACALLALLSGQAREASAMGESPQLELSTAAASRAKPALA